MNKMHDASGVPTSPSIKTLFLALCPKPHHKSLSLYNLLTRAVAVEGGCFCRAGSACHDLGPSMHETPSTPMVRGADAAGVHLAQFGIIIHC